jgi:Holliday junction resolvasome RuvABC endonuclease subunit
MAGAHNLLGEPMAVHRLFSGHRTQRAGETLEWLHLLFNPGGEAPAPELIVYEQPFARGAAATRCLWGIAGIIEALAHNAGAACLCITPSEIKKWATGAGTADKDAMTLAAHCMGYAGENEHEADAWCLLKFAEATIEKR